MLELRCFVGNWVFSRRFERSPQPPEGDFKEKESNFLVPTLLRGNAYSVAPAARVFSFPNSVWERLHVKLCLMI